MALLPLVLVLSSLLFLTYGIKYYCRFVHNLTTARRSGLPCIVSPIYTFSPFWLLTYRLWLPLIKWLPQCWTSKWIDFLDPEWTWKLKHRPFVKLQSDVFMVVSPVKNTLFVADADAIDQIIGRRVDFPKPLQLYRPLGLFGCNVLTTEGHTWRHHRKHLSPAFNEKLYRLVWSETLHQGQSLLRKWIQVEFPANMTVFRPAEDVLTLGMHVISRATLGIRLQWPCSDNHKDHLLLDSDSSGFESAHKGEMSFREALLTLLNHIILLLIVPKWLLFLSPFASQRNARRSFVSYSCYLRGICSGKWKALTRTNEIETDIMSTIMSQHTIINRSSHLMTNEEILGNMFILLIAGHETVANTIHCALIYLALNQKAQFKLQRELDSLLGGRSIEDWDYDSDMLGMVNGMLGAVMDEVLRLVPPIIDIPKCTLPRSPQLLRLHGRVITIPEDTLVKLVAVAVHRNPKFWPAKECSDYDLDQFDPDRWLLYVPTANANMGSCKQAKHYNKNAYIPFGKGPRACLGRRFAQVEILAMLALIFKENSVELAVDAFASDEKIEHMSCEARRTVWQKAADHAHHQLTHNMKTVITLQMRGGSVPIRLVKRGREKFAFNS